MKRIVIFLFLIIFTGLNASYLIDLYHKDYGVIDRTVLVFDTKPDYEILKHESDIQININNCRKDASLKSINLTNSKVLTGINYLVSKDKVMVMLDINTTQLLISGEIYKVDGMELKSDLFKLVLDIFIATNPQSLSDLTSYSNFYTAIGNKELADQYNQKIAILNEKLKDQVPIDEVANVQTPKKKISSDLLKKTKIFLKEFSSKFDYKLVGILFAGIILLVVVIILIVKFSKKGNDIDKNSDSLRSTSGFAEMDYLEKIVKSLADQDWDFEEIAKEVELPVDEVQRIIAPDIVQEVERL
ncbi:MAG: hypothetical protein K9N07_03025 [Candidatus Cloacimonetes bacterium]|nr:hypothetical protein [Candidatus Cloacimonadota bacterium]